MTRDLQKEIRNFSGHFDPKEMSRRGGLMVLPFRPKAIPPKIRRKLPILMREPVDVPVAVHIEFRQPSPAREEALA